ncbi:MAG TPA: hypothetical protein VFO01_00685 [Trebonia sp.]|nr:hypothetical protein [Trebonia sp.]
MAPAGSGPLPPVVISRQSNTTFSDKSQVWADNAASSPFFGNVYVCWAMFQGQEKGNAAPAALQVAVSRDGGTSWTQHQISAAANNGQRNPPTAAPSAPTAWATPTSSVSEPCNRLASRPLS